jgi:hypothetical protein
MDTNLFSSLDPRMGNSHISEVLAQATASKVHNDMVKHGFASIIHEDLMEQIAEFEKSLKADEEVGAYLASFNTEILVHLHDVGYQNPYLIIFTGTNVNNNQPVQLVQHVSQLNVLFTSVKVKDNARRIGFHHHDDEADTSIENDASPADI